MCWGCFNAVWVAVHLSTNLYFICLWHLCSIFLCLHLSNFSANLSLRVLPHTLTHLSFPTCFSIWLLYHLTFHFSFHAPFFNLHLTSSYHCQRIRRLVVPSFTQFLFLKSGTLTGLKQASCADCFVLAAVDNKIRAIDLSNKAKYIPPSPLSSHWTKYLNLDQDAQINNKDFIEDLRTMSKKIQQEKTGNDSTCAMKDKRTIQKCKCSFSEFRLSLWLLCLPQQKSRTIHSLM